MNILKIETILDALQAADVFVVDSSPYLHSYNQVHGVENDPNSVILEFSCHDDEGQIFEWFFTEQSLNEATINYASGTIELKDVDGKPCTICLYNLVGCSIPREELP